MRAGGSCAAQQTLSPESASVLKHSLSLARRRGHAQVTPLHVAATLLTSSRSTLLRRACLTSLPHPHPPSHPLHSRALDLCFNVALNRLPAAPSHQPSLSNALVAALKRAQAHQRRGCIEHQQHQQQQQQPPLIAVKVELEQLILSILDDPSVSRVMREAGFSSTSVKNNLEADSTSVFQCYSTSGGIYSTPNSPPTDGILNPTTTTSLWYYSQFHQGQNHFLFSKPPLTDDINVITEVLIGKKKRNAVIVGDSLSTSETLVSELMTRVEKNDVPDELKSAKLIKFQFSSVPLKFMNREEVNSNVADLKRKVDSSASGGKVVIYIGDLKWAVERERDDDDEREGGFCSSVTRESSAYNPIEHLIVEIGKLVSWYNSSSVRVWLVATANYQTYMKCQMKQPPLDVQWALQAVSVPSGGLGLSLNAASGRDPRISFSENSSPVSDKKLFLLKEEAGVLTCCPECRSNYEKEAASPQLPYWLKSHANGSLDHKDDLDELRRKYNKLCQSVHQGSQNAHNQYHSTPFPCWPNKKSNILTDSETISFVKPSTLPRFRRQQSCHIEFSFSSKDQPNFDSLKGMEDKITLALGNSIYADTADQRRDKLAELCKDNVPWQSETIPLIVEAVREKEAVDEDTFILIQGNDVIGKRRLALAIAESMFGSSDLLFSMKMRENGSSNRVMLERALRDHGKIVVLVEDVDFANPEFVRFLRDGLEAGKLETWGRKKSEASKAIVILTMDGDTKGEDISSAVQTKLLVRESKLYVDRKRKAEWDFAEEEEAVSKRQVSPTGLDLNMKATEEDECRSDEIAELVKKMKKRFVLNRRKW